MAPPHVYGALALMRESDKELTPIQVANINLQTARDFPSVTNNQCTSNTCDAGILDANVALLEVKRDSDSAGLTNVKELRSSSDSNKANSDGMGDSYKLNYSLALLSAAGASAPKCPSNISTVHKQGFGPVMMPIAMF